MAQWVDLPDQVRKRSISARDDAQVWVRQNHLPGAAIKGAIRLSEEDPRAPRARVAFRVRLAASPNEPGRVVFERFLESPAANGVHAPATDGAARTGGTGAEPFEVSIPETLPFRSGFVGLEVKYESPSPAGGPEAEWIEPSIETRAADARPSSESAWNVLLITSDTTRQDDLGCYGGRARTPSLDHLAADGVVFTEAYTAALETAPSHASLMTSSHARDHGVYDNAHRLDEARDTIAEALQRYGYQTAGFVSGLPVIRAAGFAQGFDLFDDAFLSNSLEIPGRRSQRERPADETASLFLDWYAKRRSGSPFFAWLHFFDPHQPYAPPRTFRSACQASPPELESLFVAPRGEPRRIKANVVARLSPTRRALVDQIARSLYRGEISFVDAQVGRLIEALERSGEYDRTIIVFAGDHGENFGLRGALAYGHEGLFHDVTRIPLIVKFADQRFKGRRTDFLVGNLDVAPTLLESLRLPEPPSWRGRSFLGALASNGDGPRDSLVIEARHGSQISVRTPTLMYLRRGSLFEDPDAQLFDLAQDPDELTNRVADPGHQVAAVELAAVAARFLADGQAPANPAQQIDETQRRQLRALGYAD